MDGPEIELTKRSLLSVTGASMVGAVGVSQAVGRQTSYDRRTVFEGEGVDLRVEWREWYNGTIQKPNGTQAPDSTAPVVSLSNLRPGDEGKLAFGLTTTGDDGEAPPARVQARVRVLPGSDTENGITEPEAKAGDDSTERGELGEDLDLRLWYDTGFTVDGTSLLGHCDGTFDDTVDNELTRGPLDLLAVSDEAADWIDLDAYPSEPTNCLASNETLCLGMEWQLPAGAGNRVQTDGIAFVVEFRAVQCGPR